MGLIDSDDSVSNKLLDHPERAFHLDSFLHGRFAQRFVPG